ncbi:leucyl aminopeptidase family protein [Rhizosaccharibacter radicis]|uniref:Leucyl aminopeptidase family protein n=1 Tax=Rhizosaccharibacter radicis TaxID=2782605 RepID=A0ABT1VWA0_9PROT|nr:leucyl aminopeptidase family protein [Acetobacteraceae bacterium KSS12]
MSEFLFDRAVDCLVDGTPPDARVVHCVRPDGLEPLLDALDGGRDGVAGRWLRSQEFKATGGSLMLLPGPDGVAAAVLGLGEATPGTSDPTPFGALAFALPEGAWTLQLPEDVDPDDATLGFCLGAYRFTPFKKPRRPPARLVVPPGAGGAGLALARAAWLARDLINMPADRLGPRELAEAGRAVAASFGAECQVWTGEELDARYPTVAAVGRGSARAPHVLVASWRGSEAGEDAPLISLVGKGVCFDTGGYDLKPSSGMLRMKKDMGGAATILALARVVMERDLPVRLEMRLGCAENSVSGTAMRPGDVLRTRKGLFVEVGNTDAEGRLVLCDLLDEAAEAGPALLVDVATLTGAARVALGPDLPALFSNDDSAAERVLDAGRRTGDPLWRLPLWGGYDDWMSSPVADLNNASSRPMAGAVTAALFLQRFVPPGTRWLHVDSYAWNDSNQPGRPEGGEALALRALYGALLPIVNVA